MEKRASSMSKWYRETVAKLTIVDAIPRLRAEEYAAVRALDEERVRLAEEYERADGALLLKMRALLAGTGLWSEYLSSSAMGGYSHIHAAEGHPDPIQRVSGSVVHHATHCRWCDKLMPECACK